MMINKYFVLILAVVEQRKRKEGWLYGLFDMVLLQELEDMEEKMRSLANLRHSNKRTKRADKTNTWRGKR